jgi:hypothetical protein
MSPDIASTSHASQIRRTRKNLLSMDHHSRQIDISQYPSHGTCDITIVLVVLLFGYGFGALVFEQRPMYFVGGVLKIDRLS